MRKSMHAMMVLVALVITIGCASVGFGQRVGGYSKVAADDPGVVAAAEFAVSAQKEKTGGPLSLVSIKHAERQVVAGMNYKLCLEVKAADETDAGVEPQDVQAVVWNKLTRRGEPKKYELTSWKEGDCDKDASAGNHALVTSAPAESITSVYTPLSKCKTVATGQDSSTQVCPGVGGYKLRLEYADVRESITVVSPNGKQHQLDFWSVISSAFSNVGQKAEWRVATRKGKLVPLALIVRFNASENSVDSTKETSYLAVAKITPLKICVTDKIAPGATANEEARRAADASSDKPCLEPPTQNH